MVLNQIGYNKEVSEEFIYEYTSYVAGSYEIHQQRRTSRRSGKVQYDYSIRACQPNRFLPFISYDTGFFHGEPKFEIQTTGYGSLEVDKIREVIAGYQEAVELVELLTETFVNGREM